MCIAYEAYYVLNDNIMYVCDIRFEVLQNKIFMNDIHFVLS